MARSDEPLLSNRRDSSDASNDGALSDEDALLTGQSVARPSRRTWKFWREIGLFTWAVVATAAVIILAVVYQKQTAPTVTGKKPHGKRNLVFMVSDGMGPQSMTMTRSFRQFTQGLPIDDVLVLEQHMVGQSRTRSSSSLVTDSAAGATAFSCGMKSYNGAISVLPDHSACGTVLEAAKKAGYMTGLVVTTRITDATPACFASHVNMRSEEDLIAEQMVGSAHPLGRVVDLMLGGGRCHFLPNSTEGSCRDDDVDVVKKAKKNDFSYISSRKDFDHLDLGNAVKLPLLGLFAPTDIPYEIDRRNENDIYPSLDEMARTALRALSTATQDSDQGFFLMIEGSRIDHAGHGNDPAAQVHEVLAYDRAVASVLDFLEDDEVPGVMVSTSDHETGGLSIAKQLHESYPDYLWHPSVLANATASSSRLAHNYHEFLRHHSSSSSDKQDTVKHLKKAIRTGLGIHDAREEEIDALLNNPDIAAYTFADMISRRAQTGWSTHGHSGVDVNIYASDPHLAAPLLGNHENTEVGEFLADFLSLDVEAVTQELKDKGSKMMGGEGEWMGKRPSDGERLDGQDHLDHYTGDAKLLARHKRDSDCGCGMH